MMSSSDCGSSPGPGTFLNPGTSMASPGGAKIATVIIMTTVSVKNELDNFDTMVIYFSNVKHKSIGLRIGFKKE